MPRKLPWAGGLKEGGGGQTLWNAGEYINICTTSGISTFRRSALVCCSGNMRDL